ncbi:jg12520 [Pararge aegeria aegeria]|uniref:Jg12520 protein n=1 Tax=Pararge aegeria aegeria TaxID=348720 RepID=A0A8S4R2U8_9NEOP|nr:jg12520 [Pararge aegeria aegeria]
MPILKYFITLIRVYRLVGLFITSVRLNRGTDLELSSIVPRKAAGAVEVVSQMLRARLAGREERARPARNAATNRRAL